MEGIIYEGSDNFGMFVAVDDQFSALIPKREVTPDLRPGMRITARVTEVKPDGKLNLSVREKAFIQMDKDALMVLKKIEECVGTLPAYVMAHAERIKHD